MCADEGDVTSVSGVALRSQVAARWRSARALARAVTSCLVVICAVVAPVSMLGQSRADTRHPGNTLSDIFRLPSEIPGTSAYDLQQTAAELESVLADLDAIVAARVSLVPAGDHDGTVRAAVRLQLAAGEPWSQELCRTVSALVRQLEPGIAPEAVLIVDLQGHILSENGRFFPAAQPMPGPASGLDRHAVPWPVAVGFGLGLAIALIAAWRLLGAGITLSRPSRERPPESPWAFLAAVERGRLTKVLASQRPEVVGAISTQLDDRSAARLRPVLRAIGRSTVPVPQRAAHPAVVQALVSAVRQELAADD